MAVPPNQRGQRTLDLFIRGFDKLAVTDKMRLHLSGVRPGDFMDEITRRLEQ
jgi:hypothetical protein